MKKGESGQSEKGGSTVELFALQRSLTASKFCGSSAFKCRAGSSPADGDLQSLVRSFDEGDGFLAITRQVDAIYDANLIPRLQRALQSVCLTALFHLQTDQIFLPQNICTDFVPN